MEQLVEGKTPINASLKCMIRTEDIMNASESPSPARWSLPPLDENKHQSLHLNFEYLQVANKQQDSTVDACPIPPQNKRGCNIYDEEVYKNMYSKSISDKDQFWKEMALTHLRWTSPFTKTQESDMSVGHVAWFLNGKLNVCDNCVDRWAETHPNKVAVIYEGDEYREVEKITFANLLTNVCKFANMLLHLGVRKGDIVTLYMPMYPMLVYGMLACARIGAVHSVVFGGFSSTYLRERLDDTNSEIVITVDQSIRGGNCTNLKAMVDEALTGNTSVKKCVVFRRLGDPIPFDPERDLYGNELMSQMRPYCPCVVVDSEDPLFVLHTSVASGKSEGICHSSAGYLLYAALTHKFVFDYRPGDVIACVGDLGWITGHTYTVYGPLCNGGTTVLFESIPTYPDAGRYWRLIQEYQVTSFYTAPTAIRLLMRFGKQFPKSYDLTSLRVLGSVGEKINREAWEWYNDVIGNKNCSIVDTYWQTESGGIMITTLPGAHRSKPCFAGFPFFGVEAAIVDPKTGKEITDNNVAGVLCYKNPWPGMMRTAYGNHQHFLENNLKPYTNYFFTGDGAYRDNEGYYCILGRVDDVMNIAGHKFAAAQFEVAINSHQSVKKSAVFGIPHPIKGTAALCFALLKADAVVENNLEQELRNLARRVTGPVGTPDYVILVDAFPKTLKRTKNVSRDCLHKLALQQDVSEFEELLENPDVIGVLRLKVDEAVKAANV